MGGTPTPSLSSLRNIRGESWTFSSSPSHLPLASRVGDLVGADTSLAGFTVDGLTQVPPSCFFHFLGLSLPRPARPASCLLSLCCNMAPREEGSHVLTASLWPGGPAYSRVCHTAPGCRVTGGWGQEAPLGLPDRASRPPSSSEQLCFGEMLGTCPEIRELLLCFPFGFYPYVQDSLDRKAGRQGGEQ